MTVEGTSARRSVSKECASGPGGPPPAPVTTMVPTRACLSGEDLDWLGGRAVCLALDLTTTVRVGPGPAAALGGADISVLAGKVWTFLQVRLTGVGPPPAAVVSSRAPAASGLSSSTALIVGLFRACLEYLSHGPARVADHVPVRTLAQWTYEFEFEICHGGGMDQLSVILGGALLVDGMPTGLPVVRGRLDFPDDWAVVVVDSATTKSTTDHIRTVRTQAAAGDPRLSDYLASADHASGAAWQAICDGDLPALQAAMRQAHGAMRDIQGMSTPLLEDVRRLALNTSGLRLKISGAGGGGSLVGICPEPDADHLVRRLRRCYRAAHPEVRVLRTHATPLKEEGWLE